MIIDAHVHLSCYGGKGSSLEEVCDTLLREMAANGITHAIVIPDNLEGNPEGADLERTLALIENHPNLYALGSPQIIQRGFSELEKYRTLLQKGVIKGIKFFPGHDPFTPVDERCWPYYAMLHELGYPVVIHTGDVSCNPDIHTPMDYNDPKYIVEVARRYPRLKVVIAHLYWPKIEYCYEITKDVPNIYFDLSACGDDEVIQASGGLPLMQQVLRQTIADRPGQVMYATDWPLTDSPTESGFKKHVDLIKGLGLEAGVEEGVFWKNACSVYHL